jgi:protein arginine N-methyltransferase 5
MFSWFPILFPLREPIQLKKDDIITLHFWRLVSKEKWPLFFSFKTLRSQRHIPKSEEISFYKTVAFLNITEGFH